MELRLKHVLLTVTTLSLLGAASGAHAATPFDFESVEGLEKCFAVRAYKDGGHYLTEAEIHLRCLESAQKLAGARKDLKLAEALVEGVRRGSSPENAVALLPSVVKANLAACNRTDLYTILIAGLSHPEDYPSPSRAYNKQAHEVVKICLKDKEFKSDFLEEKESSNSYVSSNACAILKAEKLVTKCP